MGTEESHENRGRGTQERERCKHSPIYFSRANNQKNCYFVNLVQIPALLDLDYVPELQPATPAHATLLTTGL